MRSRSWLPPQPMSRAGIAFFCSAKFCRKESYSPMHSPSRPGSSPVHLRSHTKHYTPLDFVQVRTPLFPIEAYLTLQEPSATSIAALHPQNPLVRRALAIGSIDLLEELDRQSSSSRE